MFWLRLRIIPSLNIFLSRTEKLSQLRHVRVVPEEETRKRKCEITVNEKRSVLTTCRKLWSGIGGGGVKQEIVDRVFVVSSTFGGEVSGFTRIPSAFPHPSTFNSQEGLLSGVASEWYQIVTKLVGNLRWNERQQLNFHFDVARTGS